LPPRESKTDNRKALATLFLGCFRAEKLSRREQQDGTEKGKQHPPCVCFGSSRNVSLVVTALTVTPMTVAALTVAALTILAGIRQRGENQGGCYQSADFADVLLQMEKFHRITIRHFTCDL